MLNIFGRGKKSRRVEVKTPIQKINESAIALVDSANEGQRGTRIITKGTTLEIVRRSLVRSKNESFSVQKFRALKDVSEHIALAQRNKVVTASAAHFDLLPLGHPSAKRDHELSSRDVMRARARWFADDPIVVDEGVSSLLATAFSADHDSPEYMYASAKLLAMGATRVPITALVAVALGFNDGANRGFWRQQLRDRNGRFAKMGGKLKKLFRRNGQTYAQYGDVVSTNSNDNTFVMETPDNRLISTEATAAETEVKALLPDKATPDGVSSSPVRSSSADPVIDEADFVYVNQPDGFIPKNTNEVTLPNGVDANDVDSVWEDDLGNYQVAKNKDSDLIVSRLEQDRTVPFAAGKRWSEVQNEIISDEPRFEKGDDVEVNLPEGMDIGPSGDADTADAPETPGPLKSSVSAGEIQNTKEQSIIEAITEEGRFPLPREATANRVSDIQKGAKRDYQKVYDLLSERDPEFTETYPDMDSFWDEVRSLGVHGQYRAFDSQDMIPEEMKVFNRAYAEAVLGMDPDGEIVVYRNAINLPLSVEKAGVGYWSTDKDFAQAYGADSERVEASKNGEAELNGFYEGRFRPDQINGMIGYSQVEDEFAIVISPDTAEEPGRVTRIGPLDPPKIPEWLNLNSVKGIERQGGTVFRHFNLAGALNLNKVNKNPLGDGDSEDFLKENGLEGGSWQEEFDKVWGAGSYDEMIDEGDIPPYSELKRLFVQDDDGKWFLDVENIAGKGLYRGYSGSGNPDDYKNDRFDSTLKVLETIQNITGEEFMSVKRNDVPETEDRVDATPETAPDADVPDVPEEPPTPEATPGEEDFTPDELAAGYGWSKSGNKYERDNFEIEQLPNGKWLLTETGEEGAFRESGPFDSPAEAFEVGQIEAGGPEFDLGQVIDFREDQGPDEAPEPEAPEPTEPGDLYEVNRGPYTPQGPQEGVDSEDYTDDPVELAQRFDPEVLESALEEAVRNGEGEALLPFDAGDEYVPAEALYNALIEADRDPDALLDEIYSGTEEDTADEAPEAEEDVVDEEEELAPITPEEVAEQRQEGELPALLDGLSDEELADVINNEDYRQYLPENEEFDVPEGMYEIDSDALDPAESFAPGDAPEDAPGTPIDMAVQMSTEDLEAGLRGAIAEDEDSDRLGYYPIQVFDEDGEEYSYDVPAEAWRDALQLQGIDTNEILGEAYEGGEAEPEEVEEALIEEGEEPIAEGEDVPEELLEEPFDPTLYPSPQNIDKVPVGGTYQVPLSRAGDRTPSAFLKLQRISEDEWLATNEVDGSTTTQPHSNVRQTLQMYGARGDDGMRPTEIDGSLYSYGSPQYTGIEETSEAEVTEEQPTPEAPAEEAPRKEMKSEYLYQGGAAFLRGRTGAPFRDPEAQEYIRSKGFEFYREWNGKRVFSEVADLSLPEFKEVLRDLRDRFGIDLAPRFEGRDIDIDAPDEEAEVEAPEAPEAEAAPSPPITSRFGGEISNDWVENEDNAFDVNEAPIVGDIQVGDFISASDGGWHEVINLEPDPEDPDGTIVTKMRLSNGEVFRGRKTTKRSPGLGWANGKEISGLRRRKDFDGLSRDEIEGRSAQAPEEMLSNSPAPEAPAPSAGTGGRPTRSGAYKIPRPVRPAFFGRVQDIVNGLDEKNGPNLWEALKNERIVAFDFETVGTGNFDYDNPDEPIALAAYVYENGEKVDEISLFMNPDRGLAGWYYVGGDVDGEMKPERMLDADGNPITDEWLATQPSIGEQIKKFLDFAGPNAILLAQNAEFDTSMLEFWARENGVDFTANDVIDTLPIADSLFGKGNASLGMIADQLDIEVDPNMLHNAGTDASILHEALGKMLAKLDGTNREFDLERANAAYEAGLAQYKFNVAQKEGQKADSAIDPVDADDLDETPLSIVSVFGDEISNEWVENDENTTTLNNLPTGDVRVGDFISAKGGGWHEVVAVDPDPVSEDAVILTKRRLATGEVKRGRDSATSAGILGWFKKTPLTVRRRLTDADLPEVEEAPVVDLVDKVPTPEIPTTKEEAVAVVGEAIDNAIENDNNVSDNVDAPAIDEALEGSPSEVIVDTNRQGFSETHLDANGTPLRELDRVRHVKTGRIGTVRTPMEEFKSGKYIYNNYLKVHFDDAPKREPVGANRLELISEGTDSPSDYSDVTPTPAEVPETPPTTPETSTEPPVEVPDESGLTETERRERFEALQALDPMSDINDELETSNTYEVNITPARARGLIYSIGEKYGGASWGDPSNGGSAKENEALDRLENLIVPIQSKGGKIQITPREMWVIQSEISIDLNYYKEASDNGFITSEERGTYKALLNLNNDLTKLRKDLGLIGSPSEKFYKQLAIQNKYDSLVSQRETRAAELQMEQDYAADLRDEETPTVEDLDRDPEQYEEEEYPPTTEQRRIISAIMTGKSVIVRALAGTGKTSTLKLAAKRLLNEQPDKKIVYVAFNKTVQEEANTKMPANVEARTADSIAFRWAPKEMTAKYTNQRNNSVETARTRDEIAEALGIPRELRTVSWESEVRQDGTVLPAGSFDTVDVIRSAVDAWTISDKDKPEIPVEVKQGLIAFMQRNKSLKYTWFYDAVEGYIEDLQSPIGVLPINNGHITKFWALSNPDLSASGSGLARKADIIFFDEAQDINPVLAKVIADQKMQKVYVGDGNQAIYGFRGAVDQLDKTQAPFDLPMTQSFRFGPQISGIANRFLEGLGSPYRLRGSGPDGEVTFIDKPDAILARTNAGVVKEALSELNKGNSVAVPRSTKDELKSLVRTVRWFKEGGNKPRSLHPDLAEFKDWGQAQDAGSSGDNPKVRSLVTLVEETFEGDLNELETFVDDLLVESQISKNVGDAPTSALDGESGDVGESLQWRVEGTDLIITGKTFESKEIIKSVGGRFRSEPEKQWFFPVADDDARLDALNRLRNAVLGTSGGDENITVITTAHKSKGLEWDTVRLSDDFFTPRENPDGTMQMPSAEEMRLDYVALTRGRQAIDPGSLEWIYDYTSGESENPDRGDYMQQGMDMAVPNGGEFESSEVGDNIADTATKLDKASEEVADLILSLLEKGVAPWQKPWTGGNFLPTNYATGRSYNGLNVWTLLGTMEVKGYNDNRWMTFNQAKKLGGFVRKGEKATPVIYMSPIIKKKIDESTGEEKEYKIWTSRIYRVFNVAQIDGIDIEPQQEKPPVPVSEAETTLLDAYKDRPEIFNVPQDQAYYTPIEDVIRIPLREQFDTPAGYFETLAHELAHSTAHKSRLDRTALTDNYGSHKESRGLEELIAEISVALVAGRLNADFQIESVAAYADSWLNALKRDKSMILKATRAAQAATDYMLGDFGKDTGKNRIPDSEEPTDDQAEPNVGESGLTGEQIAQEAETEAPATSEDSGTEQPNESFDPLSVDTGRELTKGFNVLHTPEDFSDVEKPRGNQSPSIISSPPQSERTRGDFMEVELNLYRDIVDSMSKDIPIVFSYGGSIVSGVPVQTWSQGLTGSPNVDVELPNGRVTTFNVAKIGHIDPNESSRILNNLGFRTSEDRNVGESGRTGEEIEAEPEFADYRGNLEDFYEDLEEGQEYSLLVKDAVEAYQVGGGAVDPQYAETNQRLRDGDESAPLVGQLDEAISRGPRLTRDTLLYRAIRLNVESPDAERLNNVRPGDIIENPAYTSTTVDINWAVDFSRRGNMSSIIQIEAPAGTRGLVPYLSTRKLDDEYEFVLPRGTRFQVISRNPATGIIRVRIV